MLISEVIANVKAYCGQTWDGPIYDDTTRDQVLYGPVDVTCTGIVTTCFASADVIRQAHARGANLIICHEALFWNHGDHTCWLANNKTFAAKQALLDECGITVWRLHDHIHSGAPENGRLVDSIFMGLADKLGWRDYVTGNPDRPMNFTIPETTAGELARFLVQAQAAVPAVCERLHSHGNTALLAAVACDCPESTAELFLVAVAAQETDVVSQGLKYFVQLHQAQQAQQQQQQQQPLAMPLPQTPSPVPRPASL